MQGKLPLVPCQFQLMDYLFSDLNLDFDVADEVVALAC
jgi:hypothetical protein